ncbi:MAG: gluconate 2-dehydrogenase subunit 3 family protein [Jejuia sp.]
MKRRDALKQIGIAAGYVALAPSAFSILQGCTTEVEKWIPQFLSTDEGSVLKHLIDLILPKTSASPGALEVNVPEFIDLLAFKSYDDKSQQKFKEEMEAVVNELMIDKAPEFLISDLKKENYDALLHKYLKSKPEDRVNYNEAQELVYSALTGIRGTSVWAYRSSQLIGEQVLPYLPVPGYHKGCIDVNDATKGKSWAL